MRHDYYWTLKRISKRLLHDDDNNNIWDINLNVKLNHGIPIINWFHIDNGEQLSSCGLKNDICPSMNQQRSIWYKTIIIKNDFWKHKS